MVGALICADKKCVFSLLSCHCAKHSSKEQGRLLRDRGMVNFTLRVESCAFICYSKKLMTQKSVHYRAIYSALLLKPIEEASTLIATFFWRSHYIVDDCYYFLVFALFNFLKKNA